MSSPTDVGCVVEDASAAVVTSNAQDSLARSELAALACCSSAPYVLLQQNCLATDGSCTFTCVCLGLDAFADISGAVLAPGSAACGSNLNCSGVSGMYCGHVSSDSWEVYVHDVVTSTTTGSSAAVGDESTSITSDAGAAASTLSSARAGVTVSTATTSATLSASAANGADSGSATTPQPAVIGGAVVATVVVVAAAAALLVTWTRRRRRIPPPSGKTYGPTAAAATTLDDLAAGSLPRPANAWRHLPGDSSAAAATFNQLTTAPAAIAAEAQPPPPPPPPPAAVASYARWPVSSIFSPGVSSVGISSPGEHSPRAPIEAWALSMRPAPTPPLDFTPSPPPDDAQPQPIDLPAAARPADTS
ncbi:hypothetical protein HK405_004856 [Cladochytrium tenue]|nr:hypothetical protein HK405_004856 [Cladochytrium tenue]